MTATEPTPPNDARPTNPPRELARYRISAGERIVVGQRVLGIVRLSGVARRRPRAPLSHRARPDRHGRAGGRRHRLPRPRPSTGTPSRSSPAGSITAKPGPRHERPRTRRPVPTAPASARKMSSSPAWSARTPIAATAARHPVHTTSSPARPNSATAPPPSCAPSSPSTKRSSPTRTKNHAELLAHDARSAEGSRSVPRRARRSRVCAGRTARPALTAPRRAQRRRRGQPRAGQPRQQTSPIGRLASTAPPFTRCSGVCIGASVANSCSTPTVSATKTSFAYLKSSGVVAACHAVPCVDDMSPRRAAPRYRR